MSHGQLNYNNNERTSGVRSRRTTRVLKESLLAGVLLGVVAIVEKASIHDDILVDNRHDELLEA
jgi:hypothetical protein